ncbi:hypothetical protein C1H46_038359 [Malus baccata]|uniref:Uncharacterized protein n=1 Tax=Malus baccata TaxID=106549 RepID=A0A540KPF5_MALBA|nr:hypothetical protein C1H46_038359 [Malus baccata]
MAQNKSLRPPQKKKPQQTLATCYPSPPLEHHQPTISNQRPQQRPEITPITAAKPDEEKTPTSQKAPPKSPVH